MTKTATTKPPSTDRSRASQLAAATPAGRERYVDFLRVASLAAVMFGHWLMAALEWRDGRLTGTNVLETSPAAQLLTWVFQVMPVFFVVGGFSNAASWTAARRDGAGYGTWLAGRLTRLVRPVLVFAAAWSALAVVLWATGVDPRTVRAGSIAQPLWFLAVYVAVVAVAPAMVEAHRRWAWAVPCCLAVAVAAVDFARWSLGAPLVGWLNLGLVWLFAHQLGIAWRGGAVAAWSRRRFVALAAVAVATVVALTQFGGYPRSMVGGVGEARSNTFPPSLAMVALATWQFAGVLAIRSAVDRWLARPRVWTSVIAANGMAMTVYLWHLTAMVAVAAMVLPSGLLPQPPAGSAAWWAWRPVWALAFLAALVPLVVVFAKVESARSGARPQASWRAGIAAMLATVGMSVLARKGFVTAEFTATGVTLLFAGWWFLRRGTEPRCA